MKRATIVSIGNELLNGATVDTNLAYLGGQLLALNIILAGGCVIPDDCDTIVRTLKTAVIDSDIIIITGGLGPTDDDITRQAVSQFTSRPLVLDEPSLKYLHEFFRIRDIEMPKRNEQQAYLPDGAVAVKNENGTAPGIMLSHGGVLIFALPGVPAEMKKMFESSVTPELQKLNDGIHIAVQKIKCCGKGESAVAVLLGDRMQRGRNPLVNCTVSSGVITLTITAQGDPKEKAEKIARQEQAEIAGLLGDIVFSLEDKSLAEVVGELLVQKGRTVALAESCTGGLVGKMLTDVPGSSRYFQSGWIVYSNDTKIRELDVSSELIDKKGAVSGEVALAIAEGAKRKSKADYAIGITGIAGPDGGTPDKPVGLVFISMIGCGNKRVERCVFKGNRQSIRLRTADFALNLLRKELLI